MITAMPLIRYRVSAPTGEYVQFICRRQWLERNPPQIPDNIINGHTDALKRIIFRLIYFTHSTYPAMHDHWYNK